MYSQSSLVTRVAFLGAKGSYSHLAAKHFFASKQKLAEIHCDSFNAVIEKVENEQADFALLPIENTSSGSINEVYDQLQHTKLAIVAEITRKIDHGLIATQNTKLSDIHTIYSHPQPHQQCSQFLRTLAIQTNLCASSAEAMATVAKLDSSKFAAIASCESAKLYGLTAIKQSIANQLENYTRFIVVAKNAIKVESSQEAKTTFIMSTTQQAGALVDCLLVLKNYQIIMTKLTSRPIIGKPWQEMFYVDVKANIASDAMQNALKELAALTCYLKVLGCYPIS